MSKRKSDSRAAGSPTPPEMVCILVVDAVIAEIEIEICCQRTDGIDRVFSTSDGWLRAERPSESTLAYSVETLFGGTPLSGPGGMLVESWPLR